MRPISKSGRHDPFHNQLLRSLSFADAHLLRPMLRRVECSEGETLAIGPAAMPLIYFPETLVGCVGASDRAAGIGLVGREGTIGWAAVLGEGSQEHGRVLLSGSALAIPVRKMRAASAVSPTLNFSLLGFANAFFQQVGRTMLSTLYDPVPVRLGNWLLMLHDRTDADELTITHQTLAALLNVRRASVTDALHILEGERALRCTRGCITIRDRAVLAAISGHLPSAAAPRVPLPIPMPVLA